MGRLPTLCLLVLAPLTGAVPQVQAASLYNLLAGTYVGGFSGSVQVYRFDGADDSVKDPLCMAHTSNPLYLIFALGQRILFAVSENGRDGKDGTVGRATSCRFGPIGGHLQQISQVQTLDDHPTCNSLGHDGRYLFIANYSVQPESSVAVLPVCTDGSLAPVVQVESHRVSRVHPRQVSGHMHSVVPSPGGQYLSTPDLGVDKVFVYRYAPEQAERPLQTTDPAFVPTPPGGGPRHLIFSADGRFAYLTLELGGQVMVLAHEDNGRLRQLQAHGLAPASFQGKIGAGALHLSADGRFLGMLNRGGNNQLVAFAVDSASDQLRFAERRSVGSTGSRKLTFSPGERFIPATNQNSDQLRVFTRDPQSDRVDKMLQSVEVRLPNNLRFVAVP